MKHRDPSSLMPRRDLLKAVSLGGAGALLGSRGAGAQEASSRDGKTVRGIVFLVSDGMSPGVLTMAQAMSLEARGRGTAWWELLNRPDAARGLMETASADSLVTDSAAAASAWGGGERVNNGAINTRPDGGKVESIMETLKRGDCLTGLVSTATITHATPAGFATNVPSRGDEAAIAPQYLDRVDIVLGGGAPFFDPARRRDERDLIGEFRAAGYDIVRDRESLSNSRLVKVLGLFADGHLPMAVDHENDPALLARVPTLEDMTRAALGRLLSSGKRFLLQVEGARIDHAAHLNDISGVLGDQLAFDDAVAAALSMTGDLDDILVVVTSDHGNANPGLNGVGGRYANSTEAFRRIFPIKTSHERLFARWNRRGSEDPAVFAEFIERELGFRPQEEEATAMIEILNRRPVVEWSDQLRNPEGLLGQIAGNHTGIGWSGTTHTYDPTIVSAVGPQAQRFGGMVANTDVYQHLAELLA